VDIKQFNVAQIYAVKVRLHGIAVLSINQSINQSIAESVNRLETEASIRLQLWGREQPQSLDGKQRPEDLENCHYRLSIFNSSVTN